MRRLILLLLPVLIMSGCATPKTNYQPEVLETVTAADTQMRTAAPGDVVLAKARRKVNQGLYVQQATNIGFAYTLTQGYYDKVGDDAKSEYFMPASGVIDAGKVDKMALADPWKSVMAPRAGGRLCVVTVFHAKSCVASTAYERRPRDLVDAEAIEKQLVFRGADGERVLFDYREKRGGVELPDAGKLISHDLATGRIVSFGNLRLEVLGASGEFLTYRVLSGAATN